MRVVVFLKLIGCFDVKRSTAVLTLEHKHSPTPTTATPVTTSLRQYKQLVAGTDTNCFHGQAWDLRGSAGGAPLSNFRDGFTVSSSMGTSSRMVDFSQGNGMQALSIEFRQWINGTM